MNSQGKRGRPPASYNGMLKMTSGLSLHQNAQRSRDREHWRRAVKSLYVAANIEHDKPTGDRFFP